MVWWKAAKICRMATEWQHCVWQTLGYHSSVAEDAGLVRCNTVPLDVTPCHRTWHRGTGCDTVAPDVTPCHWMWHRATGCDTVPLDERVLLFQGMALPSTATSSNPRLTFWITWPWRWQHYATGHSVTAGCYLTMLWYGSQHRRVKEFSINLYIVIVNQLIYPLSSTTLLHENTFLIHLLQFNKTSG